MVDKSVSAQKNAERLLNDKCGKGNWSKGPRSDFNRIVKWLNRSGILIGALVLLEEEREESAVIPKPHRSRNSNGPRAELK